MNTRKPRETDSEMVKALRELQPYEQQVREGKLSRQEYDAIKDKVIAKHLTPQKEEWVA